MSVMVAGQMSFEDLLPGAEPSMSFDPADEVRGIDEIGETDLADFSETNQVDETTEIEHDGHDVAPDDSCSSNAVLPPLEVEVVRSGRRRKTAEARLLGNELEIRIPASSTAEDEQYFIDHFVAKFERSRAAAVVDLEKRSGELAKRFGFPNPASIRWVSNQKHQWGSCTPSERTIRLSDRMAGFPGWVIDYVIVHELAHLVEPDHGQEFWALVAQYPKTERARGYLMAKDGA